MTGRPPTPDPREAALARAADLVEREDAEAREAIARAVPARRRLEFLVAALAVANVFAWLVFPPKAPDASDQRQPAAVESDLRITVTTVATDLEEWRAANGGRLPDSLEQAGLAADGIEYVRLDSVAFEVRGTDGTIRVTYDSRTPVADFLAVSRSTP